MFIRTDLPLAQQIVQSNHATLEVGLRFGRQHQLSQSTSIILIAVKNEYQLLKARSFTDSIGIETETFFEPDSNLGYEPSYTSFATIPIPDDMRHHMRKFRLWRLPTHLEGV